MAKPDQRLPKREPLQVIVYTPQSLWGQSLEALLETTKYRVIPVHTTADLEQTLDKTVSSRRVLVFTRFWPDHMGAYNEEFYRIRAKHASCPAAALTWDLDPERVRLVLQKRLNGYLLVQELDAETLGSAFKLLAAGISVWSAGLGTPLAMSNFPALPNVAAAPVTSVKREGESGLTPREWGIYQMLGRGLSNRDIARQIGIGLRTVQMHVSRIVEKLGLSTRTEAAIHAATNMRAS